MPNEQDPFAEFGGHEIKQQQSDDPFAEFGGHEVKVPAQATAVPHTDNPFGIPSQESQVATPVINPQAHQQIINQPHAAHPHYQPHIGQVKPLEDGWGGAMMRDIKTSPLLQGIVKNAIGVVGGAAKLAGDFGDVMGSGLPLSHLIPIGNSTGIDEATDKAEFHAGFNVNNTKKESDQVYDYLKSKGLNPNDASQVANYLHHNHNEDDQKALTYLGGDTWLKNHDAGEFSVHDLTDHTGQQLANLGSSLLQMAPQFVGGVPSFVVDGYGKTQQFLDNSPQAANISPEAKKAISLAGGGVNALADVIKIPYAKAVAEKITPMVAKAAFEKLAQSGEKITSESLAKATADTWQTYAQKLKAGGISALKEITNNLAVAGGMAGGNYATDYAANKLTGQDIYDVSPEAFMNSLETNAAQFGIPSLVGAAFRPVSALIPKEQRNYFAQKVAEAKSDQDIEKLKAETAQQGQQINATPDQINNALNAIDAYSELKRKMPGMPAHQTNEVLGLMDQRNQLKSKLRQLEDERESTDDLFKSHIDGQISSAKTNLESLEDQIRAKATGVPVKFTEDNGNYFKDAGQGPVFITKDRYDFEKLMAEQEKPLEQRATEQGVNHLDQTINELEHENQPTQSGDENSAQSSDASQTQNRDEASQENDRSAGQAIGQENGHQRGIESGPQDGQKELNSERLQEGVSQKESAGEHQVIKGSDNHNIGITHTAPDADGLIRKALKANPGETIEVNGQVFKVLESDQSANRQAGEAKIVRMIDGRPDEQAGPIEITQRSDSRNTDRQHDNQQNISSATRLPDGRYSFGQGIRASANLDSIIDSLTPKENGNSNVDETTGSTVNVPQEANKAKQFEPGTWSAKFSELPEESRQPELENEVVKAKEVIKQLKDQQKVNTKADAVIRRIKELADHKLIGKDEAEKQIEEIDRFRDHKLDHLPETQKKNEVGDVTRHLLGEGQSADDLTGEDGQLDMDKVLSGLKNHENPEAVSQAMDIHAETVGLGKQGLIDRALQWVDDTIDTEKSKRGQKSDNLYSTIIPPSIGREIGIGALKAMRTALAATKSFTKGFEAAIKHLKAAGLDDKTIDEGRKWLHELFAGLKASHIKDFAEEQKLQRKDKEKLSKALALVREKSKQFLKDKDKEEDFNAAKKVLGELLDSFKKEASQRKLPFKAGDLVKLTRAAAAATSPEQVLKIVPDLQRVFRKAEVNKLVSDTEGLSRKVAKIIRSDKTSPAEQQVFQRVNNIKAGYLKDSEGNVDYKSLAKLNQALSSIIDSHKDVNVAPDENGDYRLINEKKANHDYLHTVADDLEAVQNKHLDKLDESRAQDLLDELEGRGKISTAGLSADELNQLKQSIRDGKLPELIEANQNQKLTDLAQKIDAADNKSELLQEHIKDLVKEALNRPELTEAEDATSKRIKDILANGIKTDGMSNSALVNIHRVLSRMAENGDLTKASDLIIHAEKEEALDQINQLMGGEGTKLGKIAAGLHGPIILDRMFKNFKDVARFMTATHMQGWNNGFTESKNELEYVSYEAQKLLGKASASDSQSIKGGYGSLRRGVIAYLLQHYGGAPEDINTHFKEVSINNLDRSIKYLEESAGDKSYRKQAEWLKQIRSELLDGVDTYEDFTKRINENHSGDLAVVQHWIDSFAKHKQALSDIELILNGNQIDTGIENYTSTSVVDSGERQQHSSSGELGEGYADSRKYLNKKSAGTTISRDLTPIRNGYLDFDFDRLQPKRFNETLMQIKMQTDAKVMDAILKDPRFQKVVFPDSKQSMRRFYNFIVETDKARFRSGGGSQTELSQALNRALDTIQSFAAIRTLGSFGQIFNQVPSVAMSTSVNLGTDAGLLGKGMRDVLDGSAAPFLDKISTSLRHDNKVSYATTVSASEHGSHLSAMNRYIVSTLNKAGINAMPEAINKQVADFTMNSLGRSDQMIAHASYLAYYLQHLKGNGINIEGINWAKQATEPNVEAMAYAQHMVDRTQAPSDRTLMAQWLRPNNVFSRMATGILMPYANFNLNAKFRTAADLNKIMFGNSPEEKAQGIKSLAATIAESFTFAAIKRYITGAIGAGMGMVIAKAVGYGDDDDKRKLENIYHDPNQYQQVSGSALQDIFLGGLPGQDVMGYGINKLYTAALGQQPHVSSLTGKVSMQDRTLMYTNLDNKKPTQRDLLDNSLGMYGPVADLALDDYTRMSDLYHGYKEITDVTSAVKKVPLTDYEKGITRIALGKDFLTLTTGLQDAVLFHRPIEKKYQQVMTDMGMNYYDGIKRVAKAIHFHDSKFGIGDDQHPGLGPDEPTVIKNRTAAENTPDGKQLMEDYRTYMKSAPDMGKLMALNAELMQSGKITKPLRETFEAEGKKVQKALNTGGEYHLDDQTFHQLVSELVKAKTSGQQPSAQQIQDKINEVKAQAQETTEALHQNQ